MACRKYDTAKITQFYHDYQATHGGRPPTVREVQAACGFSSSSTAYRAICQIACEGRLTREGGIMRGTTVLQPPALEPPPNGQRPAATDIAIQLLPNGDEWVLVHVEEPENSYVQHPIRTESLPQGAMKFTYPPANTMIHAGKGIADTEAEGGKQK